ncbi:MAG: insulinase family protein [Bdellovibrionales bacterium]
MIKVFGSALALCLYLAAFNASALPKINIENINGYEVHFVDIGRGDSFAVSYQINVGMLSESGDYMGRAHLLEHIMHNGSKAYPGKKAYHELLRPIGVNTNASTGYTRTFYHAVGTERQAKTILSVFLAALGGLDWNEQSFQKELDVVINEIVTEGMPMDGAAFHQMVFTQLLPNGHPWHHAPWGDLQSLRAMTMNKVKELYYGVYRPGNIKVTVQGNFSDPQYLEQVKQWTKESLSTSNIYEDPNGFRRQQPPLSLNWAPSFFKNANSPTESERRLYIESSTSKRSMVIFETDLSQFKGKPEAVDMITRYLSLGAPGSLGYKLSAELGWVADLGFYTERIGNKLQLYFRSSLTDEGINHVTEINELMVKALHSIQVAGIPEASLGILRDSAKHGIENSALSIADFLGQYSEFAADNRGLQEQVDSMMSVTSKETALAAGLFHPARALYVEMGPELEEMEVDANYKRKYKFVDNRAALRKYAAALEVVPAETFVPVLTPVQLKPIGTSDIKSFTQTKREAFLKERATLDFRSDLPDTAVSVNLQMAPKDPAQLVAADLVMSAFSERYRGQLNYLNFMHQTGPASGRATNMLSFTSSGENTESLSSLEWMLEEFAHFTPTAAEIDRARQGYANGANRNYVSAYSATIALWEVAAHVDPLYVTLPEQRDLARAMSFEEIQNNWTELRKTSNKEYVLVGPFANADFERLKKAAHALSPGTLDDATTQAVMSRTAWTDENKSITLPRDGKKTDSFGVVRAYRGPMNVDIHGYVAFVALESLIHAKIRGHHRDDLGLGYIHGALTRQLDGTHTHMILRGQADSPENLALTVNSWEDILNELRANKVSDKEIQDSIDDILNSYDQQNTSAREVLASYVGAQTSRHDALAKERMIEALRELKVADVKQIAERYLLNPKVTSVQLTTGDCENLLKK